MKNTHLISILCGTLFIAVFAIIIGQYTALYAQSNKAEKTTRVMAKEAEEGLSYNSPLYTFELPAEDGSTIKLSDFKDKVVLIVNVATQCNLAAKQYKELEALYQAYKDRGFEIIAIPSNDFGQELADTEERTCALEDHVETSFLITDIVHVIDRKAYNACPLYQWLNEKGHKAGMLGSVQWNFHKFLIGKDGEFIDWFAATTSPIAKKVKKAIEKALA